MLSPSLPLHLLFTPFTTPVVSSSWWPFAPTPEVLSGSSAIWLADLSQVKIGESASLGIYWLGATLLVLQILQFFKPAPPLHKQYADKEEIKERLREIKSDLEHWSRDHYKARGRMYRRINALENALSFIVGKMARDNDPDAERLERLLEKADLGGSDGEE